LGEGGLRDDHKHKGKNKKMPDENLEISPEKFKSRSSACRFLRKSGWKISTTKFYMDASAGSVLVGPDGEIALADLMEYTKKLRYFDKPETKETLKLRTARQELGFLIEVLDLARQTIDERLRAERAPCCKCRKGHDDAGAKSN
jgi:hypothetical protein